ncbi:MAG: hypothetical protein Q9192_001682 [Flavoplaca navasiana]
MLLCFLGYALVNISTTEAYLSVLLVEIHDIVLYFGSFVMIGIAGLLNYLSSVPMELNGVTTYLASLSINGMAGLLNYLSLVPMDSNTITPYLTTFAMNSIIRLLIVWIVLKWADRKLHSLGQTAPSVQNTGTRSSSKNHAKRPASKSTVRVRKPSRPRLTIRRNKKLVRRVALPESSVTKLREAVDKASLTLATTESS